MQNEEGNRLSAACHSSFRIHLSAFWMQAAPAPQKKEFHGYARLHALDPRTGFPSLAALPPMLTERHGDTVVIQAPAKVNLFLEVLGKRADGYHEIATLMVAVGLYDTLEFRDEPAGRVLLACDHTELSTG